MKKPNKLGWDIAVSWRDEVWQEVCETCVESENKKS
jgi:hypothetical protein